MKKLLLPLSLSIFFGITSCKKDVSTTPATVVAVPVDTSLQMNMYPNPSPGTFTIQTNDNNAHTIQIVDMLGQIKFKEVVGDETTIIDFLRLPSGLYYVEVTGKGKTITKKIIIQN